MKFKWILAISAIFIAGCAAYFSITGISMLFSGAWVGVAIMASSLEIGKLVAASYLHRNWNNISKFFKIYFSIAILVLMFVTSMGIFGFLSNAYQKTALKVDQIQGKVELLQSRKNGFSSDIDRFSNRIDVLTQQRSSQEARYDSLVLGENWVNARRTYNLISDADEQIKKMNNEINARRDSVNKIESKILKIKNANMDVSKEIGGFKFVANAFDVKIDKAVKWFILILIFVFDPMAVSLVIAYNNYQMKTIKDKNNVIDVGERKNETDTTINKKDETKKEHNIIQHVGEKDLSKVSNIPQEKPNEKKKKTWYEEE